MKCKHIRKGKIGGLDRLTLSKMARREALLEDKFAKSSRPQRAAIQNELDAWKFATEGLMDHVTRRPEKPPRGHESAFSNWSIPLQPPSCVNSCYMESGAFIGGLWVHRTRGGHSPGCPEYKK